MWSKGHIGQEHFEELRATKTDYKKSEILMDLARISPACLEALKEALIETNQGEKVCFLQVKILSYMIYGYKNIAHGFFLIGLYVNSWYDTINSVHSLI